MAIVVLTVLGGGLRLFQLGAQSLWLDELFSVFLARRDWAAIVQGTMQDTMPPLYYLLLHPVLQLRSDEAAVRLVSALMGTAAIPVTYLLASETLRSRRAATVAAALVAVSPFQIAYSQEARMYALLALSQLISILFFYRAWIGGRARDWLLFSLATAIALYSHSLAVLVLIALDVLALWRWSEFVYRWKAWTGAHVVILVMFSPWVLIQLAQARRVLNSFWTPSSTVLNLLRTPYVLTFNTSLPTVLVPLGLVVVLLLFALAIYSVIRALLVEPLPQLERLGLELALSVTLLPPALLLALSLIRPLYVERVLITCSMGLCLVWGWAWTHRSRLFDRVSIGLAAVLLIAGLANYYQAPDSQKPPMRKAAAALAQRWLPGQAVLHTSDWSALAFKYYLPEITQHFLSGDPDYADSTSRGNSGRIAGLVPEPSENLLGANGRLWLVVALEHSEEYQQGRVEEFSSKYRLADQVDIGRIYLLEYQR